MMFVRSLLRVAVMSAAIVAANNAAAETDLRFALDWQIDGAAAPFLVAIDNGYYAAEGLNVTVDPGEGAVAGIPRVASGTYPIALAGINSLIKFRDQNPDNRITAVMMLYDRPPFAIISLAKTGINKPKDLEGHTLGAPADDGAYAQWKAFVRVNGIDASKVRIENISFQVREPMLVRGDVDAVTGYSWSSYFNLLEKGVAPNDIRIMLMSDWGLDLYSSSVIVNPDFAKANPKVVGGFLRAVIKGVQFTVKNPAQAIKSVMKRNQIANEKIELARLEMSLRDSVVTPWVKAHGFGDVDMTRLSKSIDQLAVSYHFTHKPKAADIFTDKYLPPAKDRGL